MSRPDNIPEKAVLASVWYVPGKGQRASRWDRVYDLRGTLLTETSHPEDFNATLPAWTPAPDECDNCGRKLRIDSDGRPIKSHAESVYMIGHYRCSPDPDSPDAKVPEVRS